MEELFQEQRYEECLAQILEFPETMPKEYIKRQLLRVYHAMKRPTNKAIRVFSDKFWPGFCLEKSGIWQIVQNAASITNSKVVKTDDPRMAEICFESCFPSRSPQWIGRSTKVLVLGENVRPSYSSYDYSFTTDLDNYMKRNSYYPVWIEHVFSSTQDLPPGSEFKVRIASLANKYALESLEWKDRRNCVVFVGNNYEPLRVSAIRRLVEAGIKVDVYGSQTRPLENKFSVYGISKVVLCPENSYHPGYTTEKILDASLSGANMIYWGGEADELKDLFGSHVHIWKPQQNNIIHVKRLMCNEPGPSHTAKAAQYFTDQYQVASQAATDLMVRVLSPYA